MQIIYNVLQLYYMRRLRNDFLTSARVNKKLYDALVEILNDEQRSFGDWLREQMRRYIKRRKQNDTQRTNN